VVTNFPGPEQTKGGEPYVCETGSIRNRRTGSTSSNLRTSRHGALPCKLPQWIHTHWRMVQVGYTLIDHVYP